MKKVHTIFYIATLLMIVISMAISDEKYPDFPLKSSAAHESSTGAPGDRTCAQSGCHEISEIFSDDTTNTLLFEDGDAVYGDKLEGITLRVRKKDCQKFGFQIVCLDSLMKNAGSWVLLDKERVQMQSADFFLPSANGRKYLTHTYKGILPQKPHEIFWEFSWLPPVNGYKGKVTFYVMSNCTNNDNTNSGDALFASSHSLTHISTMTRISEERNNVEIVAFQSGQNAWSIPIGNHEQIRSIHLFDINGKNIASTWESKNSKEIEILTQNHHISGLTFINITFESGKTLKKTVFFHD